jgi:hypothetical protein
VQGRPQPWIRPAGVQRKRLIGNVLVLSLFEGKIKRPTEQLSKRENKFVGALASAVFLSYAEPHGKIEELCHQVFRTNKSLLTFEDG